MLDMIGLNNTEVVAIDDDPSKQYYAENMFLCSIKVFLHPIFLVVLNRRTCPFFLVILILSYSFLAHTMILLLDHFINTNYGRCPDSNWIIISFVYFKRFSISGTVPTNSSVKS